MIICPIEHKIYPSILIVCPKLQKPFNDSQRIFTFHQSSEISPNSGHTGPWQQACRVLCSFNVTYSSLMKNDVMTIPNFQPNWQCHQSVRSPLPNFSPHHTTPPVSNYQFAQCPLDFHSRHHRRRRSEKSNLFLFDKKLRNNIYTKPTFVQYLCFVTRYNVCLVPKYLYNTLELCFDPLPGLKWLAKGTWLWHSYR